ncbi:MAG: hypothetical protein ACI88G_000936, partial [Woeseiaceae bacterium]
KQQPGEISRGAAKYFVQSRQMGQNPTHTHSFGVFVVLQRLF